MKTAVVFPGQGAQSVGMLSDLAAANPAVSEYFARASAVLGYDLWQVVSAGPEDKLNDTAVTQPAMLVAGYACYASLKAQLPEWQPNYFAGHSLGEYTALVAAEALSLEQAVALVAKRGSLMQQAVAPGAGAMAAVLGLTDEQVEQACLSAAQGAIVSAVNYNSPGQVVIAGEAAAVERAMAHATELGAKRVVPLAVSVPSHCALMKPAADELAKAIADADWQMPRIPVLHNVNTQASTSIVDLQAALVAQLYQPVQWVKTIEYLAADGVTQLVECGPGKVLAGLNRRIDKNMAVASIYDSATLANTVNAIKDN
ncbi:ACP S-malonyltransferase [Thiomicrospira sp. ALE5]|uniref:ACP S-malonyltransferase n=1 Tax=Thiomicrospira sp. ALE5 TaxID=748650 RepID=UPI0008E7F772|nr:ACP S-malonyltransferase [Thiomicrospira sp. ALE5]SFR52155.1 [acyl-carrier-protein] S-malonyltransferase [Thiomicrospira sp. ALE5]